MTASRTRVCKDCGKRWRIRIRGTNASREIMWACMAGVVGFSMFFVISVVQDTFLGGSSKGLSSADQMMVNAVSGFLEMDPSLAAMFDEDSKRFFNTAMGRGGGDMSSFSSKDKKRLLKKTRKIFGKNFDPSSLSRNDRAQLLKKAREVLRSGKL